MDPYAALNEALKVLTLEKFEAWLKSGQPGRHVGWTNESCKCPLAEYLTRVAVRPQTPNPDDMLRWLVGADFLDLLEPTQSESGYRACSVASRSLPRKIIQLIEAIDELGIVDREPVVVPLTAAQVLAEIERLREMWEDEEDAVYG